MYSSNLCDRANNGRKDAKSGRKKGRRNRRDGSGAQRKMDSSLTATQTQTGIEWVSGRCCKIFHFPLNYVSSWLMQLFASSTHAPNVQHLISKHILQMINAHRELVHEAVVVDYEEEEEGCRWRLWPVIHYISWTHSAGEEKYKKSSLWNLKWL